jgi:hypothetical protein
MLLCRLARLAIGCSLTWRWRLLRALRLQSKPPRSQARLEGTRARVCAGDGMADLRLGGNALSRLFRLDMGFHCG